MGYSDNIITALNYLTKKDPENYEDFIEKIKTSPIAVRVKLADLKDNMDINRITNPGKENFRRLEKYRKAYLNLTSFYANKV